MNTNAEHRFDLDWMRVLAILTVFAFHSLRFFTVEDWSVKNPTVYPIADRIDGFLAMWMMPFIFVVSGAAMYYALKNGNGWNKAGKFIKDKVLRLLVPMLFNAISLSFLQVYMDRLTHGVFTGSMIEFVPHYFQGIYGLGNGNFAIHGMHLWYLGVLFIFSLLLLPLFMFLESRIGARILRGFTNLVALPGGIYVLALAIINLWKLIDPNGFLGFDKFNWNLGIYMSFVIFGFVIISNERVQASIIRQRYISLALAIGLAVFMLITQDHRDLAVFPWILTFLGFGMKYLNVNKPVLKYAGEAVLPFYILSQTVQLSVGFFVVQLAIPDLLKWAIISVISLAIIMVTYEYLVRRVNVLRFLFGMKLMKKAPQTAAVPAEPVPQKI